MAFAPSNRAREESDLDDKTDGRDLSREISIEFDASRDRPPFCMAPGNLIAAQTPFVTRLDGTTVLQRRNECKEIVYNFVSRELDPKVAKCVVTNVIPLKSYLQILIPVAVA